MRLPFLLLLLLPCGLLATTKFTPLDMAIYGSTVSWTEAQRYCRAAHVDLVSIRNRSEASAYVAAYGWIGLHRHNDKSPWKWSQGEEDAVFVSWTNKPGDQDCVAKNYNQSDWFTSACQTKFPFTCVSERLLLVRENKTWEEALQHCRSLGGRRPYDLASLATADDHAYARGIAREAATDEVWTGLRFLAGRWWWSDGEGVAYTDVRGCPGAEACGVLEKKGPAPYSTRDCGERRNFLCYRKL